MSTLSVDPALGIEAEAETLSRMLSSITLHANLKDALMDFHRDLPESEATLRSSLVLSRMDQMLPRHVAARLRKTYSHTPAAQHRKPRFIDRLAIPLCLAAGAFLISLCVVGSVSMYRFILAYAHTFKVG